MEGQTFYGYMRVSAREQNESTFVGKAKAGKKYCKASQL